MVDKSLLTFLSSTSILLAGFRLSFGQVHGALHHEQRAQFVSFS